MKNDLYIRIADLSVCMHVRSPLIENHVTDYISEVGDETVLHVEVSDEEIQKEQSLTPQFPAAYLEYICLYRRIAEGLPAYDRTVFHGAVITYEEDGYLFTAPSGTGKSTHIQLWKQYLGDAVDIVNGDKPVLRVEGNEVWAYGTPWAGKENWQKNRSAALKGICILKQTKDNSIRRLQPQESLVYLSHQIYLPKSPDMAGKTLELLDQLIANVPIYLMGCNISEEAVKVCFEEMTGEVYDGGLNEN